MRNTLSAIMGTATFAVVQLASLQLAACAPPSAEEQQEARLALSGGSSNANRDSIESGGEVVSASAESRPIRWVSDANILSLLTIMNSRQIAAADIELEGWTIDTVRAFAASVAREHAELQHSVDSIADRIDVAPVTSALGQSISAEMQARVDALRGRYGRSLDRAFVRQQIASQESIVDNLHQLVPAAERPELRSVVSTLEARVAAQLKRARTVQAQLAVADSAAAADSAAKAEARLARQKRRSNRQ